jgi:predicted transposase YdaD
MATELLMEISQDERERAIMRSRRIYETDRFNEMQTAIDRGMAKGMAKGKAEGMAEGKAEGKAEGMAEERRKIVEHIRKEGFSVADIVRVTKLTEKEVNEILGSQN